MPTHKRTKMKATTQMLRKLFGFKPQGEKISTCAGEWRKRRDGDWQFYELADLNG